MDYDIADLAAKTAALLARFLPYLLEGGKIAAKKAFEKLGEKFTDEGWEQAEKLWGKLKPKVEAKPAAKAAVEEFSRDDEDALLFLRQQLKRLLGDDPALAGFVAETVIVDFSTNVTTGGQTTVAAETMEGSLLNVGSNIIASHGGQIHQTINNFAEYDRNSDPKLLERQLINYLKWVQEYFEYIELRGIEQGESPVIRLRLDEVYIPLQAETWRQPDETEEYPPQAKSPAKRNGKRLHAANTGCAIRGEMSLHRRTSTTI